MRENGSFMENAVKREKKIQSVIYYDTKSGKVYWRVICNGRNGPVSLDFKTNLTEYLQRFVIL